jgi:hypothetical protein
MFLPTEQLALGFLRRQQQAPAHPASAWALREVLRSEELSDEMIDRKTSLPAVFRLDANARHGPALGDAVNLWQVRHTISEQLERLLGTVAREQASRRPNERILIVSADRHFESLLAQQLAVRLGFDGVTKENGGLFSQLAGEFYQWVQDGENLKAQHFDDPAGQALLDLSMPWGRLGYSGGWVAIPVVSPPVPHEFAADPFDRTDQVHSLHEMTRSSTLRTPGS